MWLSGQNRPDFRNINRFRGEVMKEIIGGVFASILELLIEQGYVKLEEVETQLGCLPENWGGDSIYGTEENLAYAEEKQSNAYLKYPTFHQEGKSKYRDDPFRAENFAYDPESDRFICPAGRWLPFDHYYTRETKTGFPTHIHLYTCLNCSDCPLKEQCARGKGKGMSMSTGTTGV